VTTAPADYTRQAVAAIRRAVASEPSFPEWLAATLATAISDRGSRTLTDGRPASWEADLVRRLIVGTVGEDDEGLPEYRTWPGGPDDPTTGAGQHLR
jgi:hypothetical protein